MLEPNPKYFATLLDLQDWTHWLLKLTEFLLLDHRQRYFHHNKSFNIEIFINLTDFFYQ